MIEIAVAKIYLHATTENGKNMIIEIFDFENAKNIDFIFNKGGVKNLLAKVN